MTIAQQLNVTTFPFTIEDKNGKRIYYESSTGWWCKREYDVNGKIIYLEESGGTWNKSEYDVNGNIIYYEDSTGYWSKREYDTRGNIIRCEDSDGIIKDNRTKIDQPTYAMLADMRDRTLLAENRLAAAQDECLALCVSLENQLIAAFEQRDTLAENLKQIYNVSSFDYDTMPEAARKKYREVVFAIADKALRSLTEKLT